MATNLQDAINDGNAYTWHFVDDDIDTLDTLGLLKNTGTKNMRIVEISLQGGNVASLYNIHVQDPTVTGTPTGTAVVAVKMGRKDNNNATKNAVAKADETGYATQGDLLYSVQVPITTEVVRNMHNMILEPGAAIAVDQVTEATAGGLTIVGYFES